MSGAGSDIALELVRVSKSYSLEHSPWRRLWQQLGGRDDGSRRHEALRDITLQVRRGEVVGLMGRNGAGKSTLLQIVCGVLQPSSGERRVQGRIAALLELGAGFNPELTGRENVRLNGVLLGLTPAALEARLPEIEAFAGIGEYIDQPVRSYSSGMFMRLAFAMATSVDPDILVIDEALSVGDGSFARKSFDRIMALKDAGCTILFCSHSTHHIETICSRAVWLEEGRIALIDTPANVVAAYTTHLAASENREALIAAEAPRASAPMAVPARITAIRVSVDDQSGRVLAVRSQESDLRIEVDFALQPSYPTPSLAVGIVARGGHIVSSAGSHNDGVVFEATASDGGTLAGRAAVVFPKLALLKGEYFVRVFLACERGIHIYEHVENAAELVVSQHGVEQGYVSLPHQWPGARGA